MADVILYNCLSINHAPIRPIGPHQIANWLRKYGYSVKVIDFCNFLSLDELYDLTLANLDKNTKAIGVSSTFWSDKPYLTISLDLYGEPEYIEPDWVVNIREKLSNYNFEWLLGGVYSTFNKELFRFNWRTFHGFAEDQILKFMDELTGKKRTNCNFDIINLESKFSLDNSIQPTEVLPIELSRGCQFKCSFCRYPLLGKKKNTYIRNMEHIKQEFIYNYENFGTTKYFFMDDTVNESEEKILGLEQIVLNLPFKLQWIGYNRLDLIGVKKHTIEILKNTGLASSYFGIESFHPKASKIIGKGWNGINAKDFLLELKEKWGPDTNFYLQFLIGLTGETETDIEKTFEWCVKNNMPEWHFGPLNIRLDKNFVTESEFDKNHRIYGYKFEPDSFYKWVNKDWKYDQAVLKSRELNARAKEHIFLSSWLLGEISTHGQSLTDLMHTKRNKIDWSNLILNTKAFAKQYVSNQLK
jgi:hypothetical protein